MSKIKAAKIKIMNEVKQLLVQPLCEQCTNRYCRNRVYSHLENKCSELKDIVEAQIKLLAEKGYGKMVETDEVEMDGHDCKNVCKFVPISEIIKKGGVNKYE